MSLASTSWRRAARTETPARPLSCNARRPLKRKDAKATDDFTAVGLAHGIDESTHADGALTVHTGPNGPLHAGVGHHASRELTALKVAN